MSDQAVKPSPSSGDLLIRHLRLKLRAPCLPGRAVDRAHAEHLVLHRTAVGAQPASAYIESGGGRLISRTPGDLAAGHGHGGDPVTIHTAAVFARPAAHDAAALQREFAVPFDIHTAAASAGPAAHDAAALQREFAVPFDIHTAAVLRVAAGDNAAGDGLFAAVIQRPHAVAAHSERMCPVVGAGVLYRQVALAFHPEHAAAAGHLQHIAVQIKHGVCILRNNQRAADADIRPQRDRTALPDGSRQRGLIRDRVPGRALQQRDLGVRLVDVHPAGALGRLRAAGLRRACRQHLPRQQAQRHAKGHQGRNDPFPHACSSSFRAVSPSPVRILSCCLSSRLSSRRLSPARSVFGGSCRLANGTRAIILP